MADSFEAAAAVSPEVAALHDAISVLAAEPLGPDYAPSFTERMALNRALARLMTVVALRNAWAEKSN